MLACPCNFSLLVNTFIFTYCTKGVFREYVVFNFGREHSVGHQLKLPQVFLTSIHNDFHGPKNKLLSFYNTGRRTCMFNILHGFANMKIEQYSESSVKIVQAIKTRRNILRYSDQGLHCFQVCVKRHLFSGRTV